MTPANGTLTPDAQLRAYVGALDATTQKLFRAVRSALRKRFPAANELAYQYPNAVVIGYAPSERGIEAIVALRASVKGVSLYFNQGPTLKDPTRRLKGSGKATRFIELTSASELSDPEVVGFIEATVAQAKVPLPASGKGRLIIKSGDK